MFKENKRAQAALRENIHLAKKHEALSRQYARYVSGLQSVESEAFNKYYFHMVRYVGHKFNVLHELHQLELTLRRRRRSFDKEHQELNNLLKILTILAKYKINLRYTNRLKSISVN